MNLGALSGSTAPKLFFDGPQTHPCKLELTVCADVGSKSTLWGRGLDGGKPPKYHLGRTRNPISIPAAQLAQVQADWRPMCSEGILVLLRDDEFLKDKTDIEVGRTLRAERQGSRRMIQWLATAPTRAASLGSEGLWESLASCLFRANTPALPSRPSTRAVSFQVVPRPNSSSAAGPRLAGSPRPCCRMPSASSSSSSRRRTVSGIDKALTLWPSAAASSRRLRFSGRQSSPTRNASCKSFSATSV